jgi:hypothetical protein
MTTDALANIYAVTDGGGVVISRCDFMPFGEEIGANAGENQSKKRRSFKVASLFVNHSK